MTRVAALCMLLSACITDTGDYEEPPTYEIIFTVTAPSTFDTLTLILASNSRESTTVAAPTTEYVWDYPTFWLPPDFQMVAYLDGAVVAYQEDAGIPWKPDQALQMVALSLHP